jgi:hypothetical protein
MKTKMLRPSCVTVPVFFRPLALKDGSVDAECNNENTKYNPETLLKKMRRSGWPFKFPFFVEYNGHSFPAPKVFNPSSLYIILSLP